MTVFFTTLVIMLIIVLTYLLSQRHPRLRRFSNISFLGFFAVCTTGAILWLMIGLLPAVAGAFPSMYSRLQELGGGERNVRVETFNSQSFAQRTLVLLAGTETAIRFSNFDPGTPHNVSLYRDPWTLQPIFVGQMIDGPSIGAYEPTNSITYTFTAPTIGTYYFQDDLHPTMSGTILVVANRGDGFGAGIARRIAAVTYRPTESQGSSASQVYFRGQIVLDYLISALNIGLGIFLIRLRPNDWAARLLALGMVGAADVFNVQAQSAFAVVPDTISNLYDNFLFVSGLAYLYALVLFPDGKISLYWPKLRWFNWPLRVLYLGLLAVLGILVGRLLYGGDPVAALAFFGLVIPITGITAQAVRYRRAATLRERQQSQALVWALSLVLMVSLVFGWAVLLFNLLRPSTSESIVDQLRGMAVIVFPLIFAMIPITLVVIMVRYRVWDIDRVVNRTLVYGALTLILGVGYVVIVVMLQQVLAPLTHGSDFVIAASTLLAAAMFRPIRARIQLVVDRRFYRHKYDAARTIEEFSHRLREQLDLDSLSGELVGMVQDTMQPTSVSLWLRPPRPADDSIRLRRV